MNRKEKENKIKFCLQTKKNIQESIVDNTIKLRFQRHVPLHTGVPRMGYRLDWTVQNSQSVTSSCEQPVR